jgi:molecular chaperone DnaK (HSP70)
VENNRKPVVKVDTRYGDKLFTPEEISAMILGKMRDIAVSFSYFEIKKER